MRAGYFRAGTVFSLSLALIACDRGAEPDLDALDNELVDSGNAMDPAIAQTLNGQIMVDPELLQHRNATTAHPTGRPYSGGLPEVAGQRAVRDEKLMRAPEPVAGGDCPQCKARRDSLTLGALATNQRDGGIRGCAADLSYSARWAQRLPADLPLHPQAQLVEAAGNAKGDCRLRIVTFRVNAPMQQMVDWYYTRARQGGYSAEHRLDGREHVLGGTRRADDSAYVLFLRPMAGGATEIDLVANNGT